jgi:catechol 2,3-dioxygenase-like lactoylglutathione lyase family enzyme
MSSEPRFKKAFPYQKDVLALPVKDLDAASEWYSAHFGMVEVERHQQPVPTVVLERDGTKLQVFFVVAPDGLCYYFHEPLEAQRDA